MAIRTVLKKALLGIMLVCLLVLLAVRIYIAKYERILNERVALESERCLKVNPEIIKRKKAYIESMQSLFAGEGEGTYMSKTQEYNDRGRIAMEAQAEWLRKDREYIDRPDVKYFLEPQLYDAIRAEHEMYMAEYEVDFEGWKAIDFFLRGRVDESESASKKMNKLLEKQNELADTLSNLTSEPFRPYPLRPFVRVNEINCPAENHNMPDMQKELFPGAPGAPHVKPELAS